MRRDGKSLAQMVKEELNAPAGIIALLAVLCFATRRGSVLGQLRAARTGVLVYGLAAVASCQALKPKLIVVASGTSAWQRATASEGIVESG